MTTTTFDTLECVEQLKAAGIPEDQAQGITKVLATLMRQVDGRVEDLASKRDRQVEVKFDTLADRNEQQVKGRLDGLATKQELDFKIKELEVSLKRDIKELELRMVIKTGTMILAGIGLLFGLMRVWPLPVQYVPPPAAVPAFTAPAAR
ncbi:MAG: hypothetical protein HQL98_00110 [Magnetococcales bacterium]|nr:hypothetical protein [Magnetococcales bacterium]